MKKVTQSENCKSAQVKLVSPVVFASVSSSLTSNSTNMLKMTGCFIKLLSQLLNILKTNEDHKDEKLEVIQTFLDSIKRSGHATQCNQIYYELPLSGKAVNSRIWPSLLRIPTLMSLGRNWKTL